MSERTIKAGTSTYWGAPAKPMPEALSKAIAQIVAQVSGIREAHLPQCFIQGDKDARQVLLVCVNNRSEIPRIAEELMAKLNGLFPAGEFIDIFPVDSNSFPPGVREADCQIFLGEKKKPWWKVW
jgi:hypothetical protein